eukprot:2186779-Ditylum_brightwellii.AAC.1
MMKHLDFMLKNNVELECPSLPGAYVDTVGENGLVDYESGTGYLSSFKTHCILKYKDQLTSSHFMTRCGPGTGANFGGSRILRQWQITSNCLVLRSKQMTTIDGVGGSVSEGSTVNKMNVKCQ